MKYERKYELKMCIRFLNKLIKLGGIHECKETGYYRFYDIEQLKKNLIKNMSHCKIIGKKKLYPDGKKEN